MYKYLYGSKMLKLDNNRDEDWITFIDEDTNAAREKKCQSIPFYRLILDYFIRENNITNNLYHALYLYQLSNGFRADVDYPFSNFNVLDHTAVWAEWLKAYMNDEGTETFALKTEILPKGFYHLLYQYYMIKENVHWISDEAKTQVQKIHDLEMPSSSF